jgi:hypothetical protein
VFNRKVVKDETHDLDETITNLTNGIAGLDDGSAEQAAAVSALKTLWELRAADKKSIERDTLSVDMAASIAASLLGIVAILAFEKSNVITSKSLSFVPKIKI